MEGALDGYEGTVSIGGKRMTNFLDGLAGTYEELSELVMWIDTTSSAYAKEKKLKL